MMAMKTERERLLRSIYESFLWLHRANGYVVREPRTELTLLEAHLLTELDAEPGHTQRSLATLLGVTQGALSKVANRLSDRKLLVMRVGGTDRRRKEMQLSARGRKLVEISDSLTDELFDSRAARLDKQRRAAIGDLYRAIADGYGHPPGVTRPGESGYRLHQRRITRCMGFLADSLYGSEFSASEWQLLEEVVRTPRPPIMKELGAALRLPPVALSPLVNKLERRKLLSRSSGPVDRRSVALVATEGGLEAVSRIRSAALTGLGRALAAIPNAVLSSWADALRVVAEPAAEQHPVSLRGAPQGSTARSKRGNRVGTGESPTSASASLRPIEWQVVLSSDIRRAARSFILKSLVRTKQSDHAPAEIVADTHLTLVHRKNGALRVVIDGTVNHGTYHLTCLGYEQGISAQRIHAEFLPAVAQFLEGAYQLSAFMVDFVPFGK